MFDQQINIEVENMSREEENANVCADINVLSPIRCNALEVGYL